MSQVIPNSVEIEVLTNIVTPDLQLKLYSNNKTPLGNDVAADYVQVVGGGYLAKDLEFAIWTFESGDPSVTYYTTQTWIFTGATNAPSTIFGYFITRVSDGKLITAERFPVSVVPFTPVAGSKIAVQPKISAESQF